MAELNQTYEECCGGPQPSAATRRSRFHRWVLFCGFVVALAGCARPAERIAEHATPSAVEGAVGALAEPDLQAQVADIAADPEVRRAAENLAATATDGLIAALGDAERQEELAALTGQYMAAVSTALARSMGQELTPEMQRLVAGSVDASIREISSERNIARIEELSQALTSSVLRGMVGTMQRAPSQEAVRSVVRDGLAPGIVALLDEDVNQALGLAAYEISRQAVLGAEAGLVGRHRRAGGLRLWFFEGPGIIVGWVILLLLVVATVALAVLLRRWRREAERRERALLSLAQALKANDTQPWAPELRESLRKELRDEAGADYLRELLRTHQDLRMRHGN